MEEEIVMDGVVSSEQPYDKIDILNASLVDLANEVHGVTPTIKTEDNVVMPTISEENGIAMPEVSINEVKNDLEQPAVVDEEQAELVKEITSVEEDATNEPSSKGQFILIGILSIILIALLIAMVVFTNAL